MAKFLIPAIAARPAATSTASSRKFLVFAVLLVLLTFPHASYEFGFKFSDSDDDDTGDQAITKRHGAMERKFKFRKIERIAIKDAEDDDEADNGDDDDEDDDHRNVKKSTRTADHLNDDKDDDDHEDNDDDDDDDGGDDDDGDDDDDDDDNDAKKHDTRSTHAAAKRKKADENEEFQFQRVRKAKREDKEKSNSHGKKQVRPADAKKVSSKKDTSDEESSFFGDLFGGWFASKSDKDDPEKKKDRNGKNAEADDDDDDDNTKATTNTLLNWLNWLSDKVKKPKQPAPKPMLSVTDSSWLSYLNRWPFNSLIPFDKPTKPTKKSQQSGSSRRVNDDDDDEDDKSCETDAASEPMSQEHFESLLHTLPGFVVNASHVKDLECKRQMQIFHHQLRGNKMWTLQMLDATGKITSGLLRGNINQFGDFDLCTHVKTVVKVKPELPIRIRGKYCLAHIETETEVPELKVPLHLAHGRALWNSHLGNPSHFAPRYSIANWGICIPHMCSGSVVEEMIETNLRPYNKTGVEFHIEVNDNDCYVRQSKRNISKMLKKDEKLLVVILCSALLVLLTIITLIMDYWGSLISCFQNKASAESETSDDDKTVQNEEEQQGDKEALETENVETAETTKADDGTSIADLIIGILKSFSPRSTLSQLLSQESNDLMLPIFHLLKVIASAFLYVCLKYLMIGHLPITNRDKLLHTVEQPISIVYRSPMIYSDVLLLVSGFLCAYQLSDEMEQLSHINIVKRLIAKILRYLPTVYLVLLLQTSLLPHLGSGPLWTNLVGQQASLCKQNMWRNILSVQNAVDVEDSCSPMTIQLALEMQLYLLGPLIVWLYHTDSDAAFFIYGALHAMSVAARFARTNEDHLSMTLFHGMNVSKFYRSANMLYSSPISRATPYLLGIGGGILHRSQGGKLDISGKFIPMGWLVSAMAIFWCLWSPSTGMRTDYVYSASESAAYASWSSLILGMALMWITFMFPRDEESFLNALSTARPVLFLSRISFPLQLATYLVVIYNTASVRDPSKFHLSDLVDLNEIACICLAAIIIAVLIDVPAQNIRRLLINRLFRERPKQEQVETETTAGTVQSEGGSSEEKKSCETPEPTESIWGSDPEEEEQKFLARRRSSSIQAEKESKETEKISEVNKNVKNDDEEEEEEEEEDEEEDIAEDEEVKVRPVIAKPIASTKPEEIKTAFTRRRRPTEE